MLAFAAPPLEPATDKAVTALEPKVIAWRRDFQEHPELGNREVRTAKIVADYLKRLGMDVQTGVAHTGVKDRRSKATFFYFFCALCGAVYVAGSCRQASRTHAARSSAASF